MRGRITRWGRSLAVRIPAAYAHELGLAVGASVEMCIVAGNLIITPDAERPYALDDLLADITDENLHSEVDFGPPQGREH